MKKLLPLLLLSFSVFAHAQEGPLTTQAVITVDAKDAPKLTADDLVLEVNRAKGVVPTSVKQITPETLQVALLIDDGLSINVGRVLPELRNFVANLPAGVEIFIGYMTNGTVRQVSYFTTDHAAAAARLRLPTGMAGISASPYFCLSDFVKHWPTEGFDQSRAARKARVVLMLTNGVDPFNGSTSVMNQDSPNVLTAQEDAQRAGVPVYSIYFGDAGFRSHRADFSGQNYLAQIAEATGGTTFWQGTGNPVSLDPFLKQFQQALSETYVITFPATGKRLAYLSVKSKVPHVKIKAPRQVQPGNAE